MRFSTMRFRSIAARRFSATDSLRLAKNRYTGIESRRITRTCLYIFYRSGYSFISDKHKVTWNGTKRVDRSIHDPRSHEIEDAFARVSVSLFSRDQRGYSHVKSLATTVAHSFYSCVSRVELKRERQREREKKSAREFVRRGTYRTLFLPLCLHTLILLRSSLSLSLSLSLSISLYLSLSLSLGSRGSHREEGVTSNPVFSNTQRGSPLDQETRPDLVFENGFSILLGS